MGEVILITSGKGGTGKSTITAGLGLMMARYGKKVCMIDANIGMRDLDFICGLADRVFYNLYDLVEKGSRSNRVILPVPCQDGLYLIPAPQTKTVADFNLSHYEAALDSLKKEFDYVLVDGAPGCGAEFSFSATGIDRALLILTPDASAVRACDKVRTLLKRRRIFDLSFCINSYPFAEERAKQALSVDEISDIIPETLVGILMQDDCFAKAWTYESIGGLFSPSNDRRFETLALRIMGEAIPVELPARSVDLLSVKNETAISEQENSEPPMEPASLEDVRIFHDSSPAAPEQTEERKVPRSLFARIFGFGS